MTQCLLGILWVSRMEKNEDTTPPGTTLEPWAKNRSLDSSSTLTWQRMSHVSDSPSALR